MTSHRESGPALQWLAPSLVTKRRKWRWKRQQSRHFGRPVTNQPKTSIQTSTLSRGIDSLKWTLLWWNLTQRNTSWVRLSRPSRKAGSQCDQWTIQWAITKANKLMNQIVPPRFSTIDSIRCHSRHISLRKKSCTSRLITKWTKPLHPTR